MAHGSGSTTTTHSRSQQRTSSRSSGGTNIRINNSNVNNAVFGARTVVMKNNQTVYKKGTARNEFNINGGNFVNSSIGSTGTKFNINRPDAAPVNHDKEWENFNVEVAIVSILKSGVAKDDFVKLLKLGYKLLQIYQVLQGKPDKVVQIIVKSMLDQAPKN